MVSRLRAISGRFLDIWDNFAEFPNFEHMVMYSLSLPPVIKPETPPKTAEFQRSTRFLLLLLSYIQAWRRALRRQSSAK